MGGETTFAQFAENVVEMTDLKSNPKHKPAYRMYPKSLSSELMFQNQYNLPDEESAKHANAIAENLSNKFNCEFDVRMRTGVNSKSGRYLFELINKFSGSKWQTWSNINSDIEEEVSLFLKESVTGSSFFSDCERR